ncbi:methyltransferase domain-containing protein [Glycomyces sp. L485]|uniref:SAM-dependent methyltransferase n=1 Tax=Glycomyces sp. L485 TaxID=2909235 RepID=UPI001F4B8720|nr:class I SAM-dependent methyltransferase [Glycomyces sp. L485]MCH7230289.1 methyltransferase domain-containing protein [Glycomyces sp. L485]
MTANRGPARYGHLDFNSPIAPWRADRLVAGLAEAGPGTIVDIGCGWGELLLRLAEAIPAAKATGIDPDAELLERGRAKAAARGLDGRVTFAECRGREWTETADLVVCIGASHAFGGSAKALTELYRIVRPGGRLVFGDGFWERVPTDAQLEHMWPGTTTEECLELADLVDVGISAGFRPLRIETVERSEWDDFESGAGADKENWLLANPGAPQAAQIRALADQNRNWWLRGHRNLLGFAYLTLGRPVA